jgi:hypothetical protein
MGTVSQTPSSQVIVSGSQTSGSSGVSATQVYSEVNAKQYGVVGDGITDDTAAFQALASAINGKSGIRLTIPDGTFIISARFAMVVNNSIIDCLGKFKFKGGTTTPYGLLYVKGNNNKIFGLTMDGNYTNAIDEGAFGSSGAVVVGATSSNTTFYNTNISNMMYTAILCDGNTTNITFDGVVINEVGEHCFYISGGNNQNWILKNLDITNFGMYLDGGRPNHLLVQHDCCVYKNRVNAGYADTDLVSVENVKVNFTRTSSTVKEVVVPAHLSTIKIKNVNTINAFSDVVIANITSVNDDVNIYMDNCKAYTPYYGTPTVSMYLEITNSSFTNSAPIQLLSIARMDNVTFNLATGSSITLTTPHSNANELIWNKVKFIWNGSTPFTIGYDLAKNWYMNNCEFSQTASSNGCFYLNNGVTFSNKVVFNQCYSTVTSYTFKDNSASATLHVEFYNCLSSYRLTNSVSANRKLLNCNNVLSSGPTGSRPLHVDISPGFIYYDTSLSLPVWSDGVSIWSPLISALSVFNKNDTGYIVPSLAAANASTYSQTGTTITVTNGGGTPVAHNIASGVGGVGYKIYLVFGSGAAVTGWYDNFTYVDANTFTCTSATSQSTSGIVNTNTSKVVVTPLLKTIPANTLGTTGKVRFAWNYSCNNSAGTKIMAIELAGTNVSSQSVTTVTFGNKATEIFAVRNNVGRIVPAGGGSLGISTSVDTTLGPNLTLNSANDFMAIESYITELLY